MERQTNFLSLVLNFAKEPRACADAPKTPPQRGRQAAMPRLWTAGKGHPVAHDPLIGWNMIEEVALVGLSFHGRPQRLVRREHGRNHDPPDASSWHLDAIDTG